MCNGCLNAMIATLAAAHAALANNYRAYKLSRGTASTRVLSPRFITRGFCRPPRPVPHCAITECATICHYVQYVHPGHWILDAANS